MNKRTLWEFFKAPPLWFLILLYLVTLGAIVGAMLMLVLAPTGDGAAVLSYVLYALAALTLAYTVYTLIRFLPQMKRRVGEWIDSHAFTRELKADFGFRTVIFSILSFAVSVAYGIFNGVLGVIGLSIWHGALATYYILLALLRGGVLLHRAKSRRIEGEDASVLALRRIRIYRSCGILLLLLQVALSAAIAQMIFDDRAFTYDWEWMIFAVAAYAFYKIITAIVNFVKGHKQNDLTVEAIRNIGLADAAVSILALQTALLGVYRTEGMSVSNFNTVTGAAVSLITLGLGVFMIVKAHKCAKLEKENGKQGI